MIKQTTMRGRGSKPVNQLAEYENFKNRLTTKYLIATSLASMNEVLNSLGAIMGNLSMQDTESRQVLAFALSIFCCISVIYFYTRTRFEVPQNHFALVSSDAGKAKMTLIYGPGFHMLGRYNKFIKVYNLANMKSDLIKSPVGDLIICIVEQGTIMHFTLGGQNIYLGPGIHKITDPVIHIANISLGTFMIDCGAEKWVTIPDNYSGVVLELGQVKILSGGRQYHLEHIGQKFVCLVPLFIQTDNIPTHIDKYLENKRSISTIPQTSRDPTFLLKTLSSDGSIIWLDTSAVWKISDVEKVVKNTMLMLSLKEGAKSEIDVKLSEQLLTTMRKVILNIIKTFLTTLVAKNSFFQQDQNGEDKPQDEANEIHNDEDIWKIYEDSSSDDDCNISMDIHLPKRQLSYEMNVKKNVFNERNEKIQITQENYDEQEEFLGLIKNQSEPINTSNANNKKKKPANKKLQVNNFIEKEKRVEISADQTEKEEKKVKDAKSISFDFLAKLQKNQPKLLLLCNKELKKFGVICETLTIQNVQIDEGVQERFDLQTKARVDLNTSIIELDSYKQKTRIETQTRNENVLRKAEAVKEAMLIKSQGESDTITTLAQARRKEAEELSMNDIAKNLELLRLKSEIGHMIFSGKNSQFIFRGPKLTDYIK